MWLIYFQRYSFHWNYFRPRLIDFPFDPFLWQNRCTKYLYFFWWNLEFSPRKFHFHEFRLSFIETFNVTFTSQTPIVHDIRPESLHSRVWSLSECFDQETFVAFIDERKKSFILTHIIWARQNMSAFYIHNTLNLSTSKKKKKT